jgi:hypothetical protein
MEVTVHRIASILLLFLAVAVVPAIAEEISLRDGTKIIGHMTAVSADKLEVETAYGKMQIKRGDILGISFPENGGPASTSESTPAKTDAPKVDETLNGIQYVNRTAKFALTLPPDWVIATDLHRAPETFAALSSRDKLRYLIVIQEEYPGSLESYKEMAILNARRSLSNFEELADTPATIDGKSALLVYYRGNLQKGSNLPVEFLSAIIPSGKMYTKISVWCVEPLFRDMQAVFEKTLNSYRTAGGQITAATSKP